MLIADVLRTKGHNVVRIHPTDIVPVHRPGIGSRPTGGRLTPPLVPRNRQSPESVHDTFLYSQAQCAGFGR